MVAWDYQFESKYARRYFDRGERRGKIHALLLVLNARGITLSDEHKAVITSCTDIPQLNRWTLRASSAVRIRELGDQFAR
ncbi:hypothetical protein AB0K00_23470 [Dactylosporangium sp. NPDC049525]|uniref:hypothetical protein n=1 Tax=Dactylosporangium sp. NPDC049525 TaxID=3154730 RepID=UPI003417FBE3